ncbi:MAG: flavodoxin-dependent (E)-4-hydroxy-3-methylbut-2-enyl-diphosphate synthase [Chloroflexi bacterium]|nr:flavodoxin-dependent (E)-4-hydroxy-3-methylbut-2-enyl-diphosphate synthase [Chloroflexota bacterium]
MQRRKTRVVVIGGVAVGGDAPVRVQSMCDTDTRDVQATVDQIYRLEEVGCELVRVAVPDVRAAAALGKIKSRIHIPLIADIHFNHELALRAIDEGVDKVRINPGNIFVKAGEKGVEAVVLRAKAAGIALRIGVNSGSIEPRLLARYGYPTPEAAVESALDHLRFCEALGFADMIVSVKFSEVPAMIRAYELLSQQVDYPLHLGVTEAGTPWSGTIKSAIGVGALLAQGIGDTLRVSLTTPDKTDEVRVAYEILKSLAIRARGPMLTSCPGCGRTEVDLLRLTAEVEEALKAVKTPLRVAVMGCVVNGPGEAAEADLAVVGGRGRGAIYRKGRLLRTADERDLVTVLLEEIATWRDDTAPETAAKVSGAFPLAVQRG